MNPLIAGALISGASSLLGGSMSSSRNYKAQKEFAQHGISWRVEDAKRAGIHPLAAIGAQMPQYSPTLQTGDFLAQAGQDIGRAVQAGQTAAEREITLASAAAALENQELQNDLLRSQIAQMNSAQLPPPQPGYFAESYPLGTVPYDGGQFEYIPQQVPTSHSAAPAFSPHDVPEVTITRTQSGGYAVIPEREMAESLESAGFLSSLQWWLRNNLVPGVLGRPPAPLPDLEPGETYRYNFITGEWKPVRQIPSPFVGNSGGGR